MNNNPIGVFDSGVGGLTAVKELRHLVPNEDIVYFGDTARVPYGSRNRETIIKYAQQDIDFLLSKNVKLIIAACGTVSSTLPTETVEHLCVPYFGVVESTAQAAARATQNKRIGVIGTNATIRSESYIKAINEIDPEIKLFANPCPLFVSLVENGFIDKDNQVTKLVATQYLEEIKKQGVDTLILGCTHYPIISEIISEIMGSGVTLIDPGKEIAKSVLETLEKLDIQTACDKTGTATYYVSDSTEGFAELAKVFLDDYIDGSVSQVII